MCARVINYANVIINNSNNLSNVARVRLKFRKKFMKKIQSPGDGINNRINFYKKQKY